MIPFIAFWVLLLAGVLLQELEIKTAVIFLAIWVVGLVAFFLLGLSRNYYVIVEAFLDCVIILMIFKGDTRVR